MDRLPRVARVVEIVESDAEESLALGGAGGVWALKGVGVLLEDGLAVGTAVLF